MVVVVGGATDGSPPPIGTDIDIGGTIGIVIGIVGTGMVGIGAGMFV